MAAAARDSAQEWAAVVHRRATGAEEMFLAEKEEVRRIKELTKAIRAGAVPGEPISDATKVGGGYIGGGVLPNLTINVVVSTQDDIYIEMGVY